MATFFGRARNLLETKDQNTSKGLPTDGEKAHAGQGRDQIYDWIF